MLSKNLNKHEYKNLSKRKCIIPISFKKKFNSKKIWETINSAISTKRVNLPLTKINTENSVDDDPSKLAIITLISFC